MRILIIDLFSISEDLVAYEHQGQEMAFLFDTPVALSSTKIYNTRVITDTSC